MSVDNQNTVQPDVISELPTELLFRVISTQHHKTNELPVSSQLLPLLEKNVSLIVEQKRGCLKGLQKLGLGIFESRQQSKLSNEFDQYGRAGLCHQIATIFQDGVINWQKIFQLLDYITDVIIHNSHGIFWVDQLCHYSETIHVSSDGQTINDWISNIEQKKPTEESNRNSQSCNSKASDPNMPENKVLPSSDYFTNCACGLTIMWSIEKWQICTQCKAYLCPVEGCHFNFLSYRSLRRHMGNRHTLEQTNTYEVKRQQYKQHHCNCGAVKPSQGTTAFRQCSTCHEYFCLKRDCSSQFRELRNLHKHLRKYHPFILDTKCAGCGGERLRHKQITQCPNKNCAIFWCNNCEFVGKSFISVANHTAHMHKK